VTVAVPSRRQSAVSPSPLTAAAAAVGAVLPAGPFGAMLGFQPLPGLFFLALVVMVVAYLLLIELGKYWFYRSSRAPTAAPPRRPAQARRRRVHRRAARFTTHHRLR
jgi:Mg2+-importing ATPase